MHCANHVAVSECDAAMQRIEQCRRRQVLLFVRRRVDDDRTASRVYELFHVGTVEIFPLGGILEFSCLVVWDAAILNSSFKS
jgi:hypothetical protein